MYLTQRLAVYWLGSIAHIKVPLVSILRTTKYIESSVLNPALNFEYFAFRVDFSSRWQVRRDSPDTFRLLFLTHISVCPSQLPSSLPTTFCPRRHNRPGARHAASTPIFYNLFQRLDHYIFAGRLWLSCFHIFVACGKLLPVTRSLVLQTFCSVLFCFVLLSCLFMCFFVVTLSLATERTLEARLVNVLGLQRPQHYDVLVTTVRCALHPHCPTGPLPF